MCGRLLRWYTIYILGGSCPWRNFSWCKIHFTSKSCVLLYWQRYCPALQQRRQPNFAAWYKQWNYGTFADGATCIQLGGLAITLGIGPHSSFTSISTFGLLRSQATCFAMGLHSSSRSSCTQSGSAVANEPTWRAALREKCCKQRWTLSVINLRPNYINNACDSRRFRVTGNHLSKVANFNLPHLHMAPPLGVTTFEFCLDLCNRKLESLGYRVASFAWSYI